MSSYSGRFADLSPSDQADIASFDEDNDLPDHSEEDTGTCLGCDRGFGPDELCDGYCEDCSEPTAEDLRREEGTY